jgi:AcrR family transcriptional regulator
MAEQISDKRSLILKAALNLISENGFHGTPMSLMAQEADVGVGTIYRYFASKEELINELYKEIKINLTKAMLRGYSESLPIRERFRQIWINLANYYLQNPQELRFLEQYSNSPYITGLTRQENAQTWEPVVAFFRYAQEQQVMKDIPLEILSSFVNGAIISLVKLHHAGDLVLDDQAMEIAVNASWDAVKR